MGFAFAEDSSFLFSAQIDYVIDAIDAVPQEMLDDQRVRIAAGIFFNFLWLGSVSSELIDFSCVWPARRYRKSF